MYTKLRALISFTSLALITLLPHLASAACTINGQAVPCDNLPVAFSQLAFFLAFVPFIMFLIFLVMVVLIVIPIWMIFDKAGKPGWTSIVPVYNMVQLNAIVGKPEWWILLMFIPFVNFIISIVVLHELTRVFGKSTAFFIGLLFLPFIFFPILGFGKAQYMKPVSTM